jgi:endonuclease/exonuclease/phosphatase family metal-dependent hydrolase
MVWDSEEELNLEIKKQAVYQDYNTNKLNIVTYNIQHGRGMDGQFNLKRTAYVLTILDPDVVLLQEVDCRRPETRMSHQAAFLARMLNMNYIYAAVKHYRTGSYGNAILSCYPIFNPKNHILPGEDGRRCCLQVEIETPGVSITVFNLHLGLKSAERYYHLEEIILPRLRAVSTPVLLGGDFNVLPESTEISLVQKYLRDSFQANSGESIHTFSADKPRARIDYIFLDKHWELIDYKIISPTMASDHLPVHCEAAIKI